MNTATPPALELRDIHVAPPPAFWPPAPGWWLLAALLLIILVLFGYWLIGRYRRYRQQQQILGELQRLDNPDVNTQTAEFITAISTLLRRVALVCYPRQQVASLSGAAWLNFLDETGGDGEFSRGAGQILEQGPYLRHEQNVPAEQLLKLTKTWIKKNLRKAFEH